MNKPERIQRRRLKGYKLPDNTHSVSRPGKWGNMFKLEGNTIWVSAEGRRQVLEEWIVLHSVSENENGDKIVHDLYWHIVAGDADAIQRMLNLDGKSMIAINYWVDKFEENNNLEELRGKNLACFCPLDFHYCHADVLLFFANKER